MALMSLTIRARRGSSSIPFQPRSFTQSVLICESRITCTADCRIMARGVVQAKHVAIRRESRTQIGIASVAATAFTRQIDPTDHNIVYAESQGGAMQRLDLANRSQRQHSSARLAATSRRWKRSRRCGCSASPAPCRVTRRFTGSKPNRSRCAARGICRSAGIWRFWRCWSTF